MRILDDLKSIRRIDRGGMLQRVAALPEQSRQAWRQGLAWNVPASFRSVRQVVVLGMGGSAIGADLIQGILGEGARRPLWVNRTYTIPRWIGRETLVWVCSYSGNTEETLSAAEEARSQNARLLAVSSGGKLADWAQKHGIPMARIPQGLPPRSAVGYLTFLPLGLMARLGWFSLARVGVEPALHGLERWIRTGLRPEIPASRNPAKKLAGQWAGRLPVLYGSAGWEGVTYRWRTQIEENAKCLAFHHIFPEATHNEISAWLQPKRLMPKLAAVFLNDPTIYPNTRRRMEFVRRIVRAQGARVLTVSAPGATRLERMLKLVALGDFASVYLAFLYKIDPTPVERVEMLKRFMLKTSGVRPSRV